MPDSSALFYDSIVVGSGAAGSVVAARLADAGERVLVLEEGMRAPQISLNESIARLTTLLYRNSGAIPFFGPFTFSFGEGRVLGGGTFVNGGLLWRTPVNILQEWRDLLPNSIFSRPDWGSLEDRVIQDLNVRVVEDSGDETNRDSSLLEESAKKLGWKCVAVPRAVVGCQNINRCAAGCPTGAKQATPENYLKRAESRGAIVLTGHRVKRIEGGSKPRLVVRDSATGKVKKFDAGRVIVSAGATQSPLLLRKSGLSRDAGKEVEFHLNFKVVARFSKVLNSERGTIFTKQVQEFEEQGILLMATNFQFPYLNIGLSGLDDQDARRFLENYDYLGMFVSMTRPVARARVDSFWGQTFGRWSWSSDSFEQAKKSLEYLSKLLFLAGAKEIVLPVKELGPLTSLEQAKDSLSAIKASSLRGVSVHAMSGCKMGISPTNSIVDLNCRVWGQEAVYVVDSSVLPSSTGESPQGTIMALAHGFVDRLLGAE